jgi:hypothetical protein
VSANFRIRTEINNGSGILFHMAGNFDGTSAHELVHTIMSRYRGDGVIMIHVENLQQIFPFGVDALERILTDVIVPSRHIFFVNGDQIVRGKEGIRLLQELENNRCGCVCRC